MQYVNQKQEEHYINYYVSYSNNLEEVHTEDDFVRIHYALKGKFQIMLASHREVETVDKGGFLIAKEHSNYFLKGAENAETCIISLAIQREKFYTLLAELIVPGSILHDFFFERKNHFAIPCCSEEQRLNTGFMEADLNCFSRVSSRASTSVENDLLYLLKQVIIYLEHNFKKDKLGVSNHRDAILEYLDANTATATLEGLAKRLNFSLAYTSILVLKITGNKFTELLQRIRIGKAKEYLSASKWALNEIAEMIGFASKSSFITFFKRATGQTPYVYRKEQQFLKNGHKRKNKKHLTRSMCTDL